eukprot:113645_1
MALAWKHLKTTYRVNRKCRQTNLNSLCHISKCYSNPDPLDGLKKDFKNYKSSFMKKCASFGGYDWAEFLAPSRKIHRSERYNPFFQFFYEQCQKKHALQIAQQMGLFIDSIEFDQNRAYIQSNLPITKEQLNDISKHVQQNCPMSKFNQTMGNKGTEWVQKNAK